MEKNPDQVTGISLNYTYNASGFEGSLSGNRTPTRPKGALQPLLTTLPDNSVTMLLSQHALLHLLGKKVGSDTDT